MILPSLQYNTTKNKLETNKMSSINYSDDFNPGDIADSLNISARRYPYISTRKARTQVGNESQITNVTTWGNQLALVNNNKLIYNGVEKATLTSGDKQFAVVNTKVVIWPDKKYYDMTTGTVKELGASASGSGATFTTNTITTSWGTDLTTLFKTGDGLSISGTTNNDISFVVKTVTSTTITATTDNIFTAGSSSGTITISRSIPDMDFICESENRLWGCSSANQTIYASALGDPTNFNVFEGTASDSYAVVVGTTGNFTACTKFASTVLFFKEDKIHKMLGSYPKEYTMYTYDMEGVQSGCHKSIQVINQILYFKGVHGIFAYGGKKPTLISSNFGEKVFTNAKGGEDGDTYYLSVKEGETNHLFCYETTKGLWVREDNVYASEFTTIGNTLYAIIDNKLYQLATNDSVANMDWMIKFKPFYETIQGRKMYSKVILRTELPQGSILKMSVSQDGKPYKMVAKLNGKNNATAIRLPITRCDKYEIKLEGKGEMAILDMLREVSVGSEV